MPENNTCSTFEIEYFDKTNLSIWPENVADNEKLVSLNRFRRFYKNFILSNVRYSDFNNNIANDSDIELFSYITRNNIVFPPTKSSLDVILKKFVIAEITRFTTVEKNEEGIIDFINKNIKLLQGSNFHFRTKNIYYYKYLVFLFIVNMLQNIFTKLSIDEEICFIRRMEYFKVSIISLNNFNRLHENIFNIGNYRRLKYLNIYYSEFINIINNIPCDKNYDEDSFKNIIKKIWDIYYQSCLIRNNIFETSLKQKYLDRIESFNFVKKNQIINLINDNYFDDCFLKNLNKMI